MDGNGIMDPASWSKAFMHRKYGRARRLSRSFAEVEAAIEMARRERRFAEEKK